MSRHPHLPAQPSAPAAWRSAQPAALAVIALLLTFALAFALALALAAPVRAQEGISVVYVVQPGDTLSSIAAQYGVDADSLITINNLKDANAIVVGQKLRVPITGLDPSQPAPEGTYRVQAGETLSAIAVKFGLSVDELMALNDLANADAVFVGQLLRVGRSAVPVVTDTPETEQPAATVDASMLTPIPTQPPPAGDSTAGDNAANTAAGDSNVTAIPELHTVQPGETLTGIARAYGLPVATLKALNNLGDADFIVVGQTIRLSVQAPDPAELAPTATTTATTTTMLTPVQEATAAATATSSASAPATYQVQAGDTLSGIAKRFGLDPETIKTLNGIEDENAIYWGQTLILSAQAAQADATATAQPKPSETPATDTPATDMPPATETPGATETLAATAMPAAAMPITRSGNPIASLNQTVAVRFGDTLSRIALRTGVDAEALRQINHFDSLDAPLNAGQALILPATDDELHPQTPAQEHVVKPGESVGAIAQAYGLTTNELLAANRIADPNAIYPGQSLLIPSPTAPGTDSDIQIGPASSGFFYYTVQPNDTLSAIAQQFGSTMDALRTYNGLPDNETIYAGLDLKIPYGAPELPVNLPPVPMSGTRFVVSLSRQQCWVFEGDNVRYAWNCSTGVAERKTKPGNYHVQSKIPNAKSKVWRLDMPYWLGIYDVGTVENGIHGLPVAWRTGKKIWEGLIGQPATFGCAMLNDANAATLYKMAFLGMPVHIVN